MPPLAPRRNMHLLRRLPETSDCARAIAIGNFDGLHVGHQAVIAAMMRVAGEEDAVPSVLTFEPHPRRFFAPASAPFRIARLRDKLQGLAHAGVQQVAMPRFDAAFAAMPAEMFLEKVLGQQLCAKAVVTGENFAFGHQRAGTRAMLQAWGEANDVRIITVPPVLVDGAICSSSAIRAALAAGDMKTAATLLGRPYSLTGRVKHGAKRGRQLGFPTANIAPQPGLVLPAYGVYAVRVTLDGVTHRGVANLGIRPTVASYAQVLLEVHLFDVVQEIYGKTLEVALFDFIRPEMKFDGVEMLRAQIAKDCETARAALGRTL